MRTLVLGGVLATGLIVAGCSGGTAEPAKTGGEGTAPTTKLAGNVTVDGSTTVYPIVELMVEDFAAVQPDVKLAANKAGTGSGFKKFLAGEVDIVTASRPIEQEEYDEAKAKGLEFIEVPIAFDGVSVVVNPGNTWAANMTLADLKKAWADGSTVRTWRDINPAWPADEITFVGPTDNHGTYEFFTEAVNGKKGNIRRAYQPNQEYTSIIQAVAGNVNTMGYVGFNFLEENKDKVKAVNVDGIEPTLQTINDGSYPLNRVLFLYVSKKAYERPEVKAFVDFALSEPGLAAVTEASYVKLPDPVYATIRERVGAGTVGTVFMGVAGAAKIEEVLKQTAK